MRVKKIVNKLYPKVTFRAQGFNFLRLIPRRIKNMMEIMVTRIFKLKCEIMGKISFENLFVAASLLRAERNIEMRDNPPIKIAIPAFSKKIIERYFMCFGIFILGINSSLVVLVKDFFHNQYYRVNGRALRNILELLHSRVLFTPSSVPNLFLPFVRAANHTIYRVEQGVGSILNKNHEPCLVGCVE